MYNKEEIDKQIKFFTEEVAKDTKQNKEKGYLPADYKSNIENLHWWKMQEKLLLQSQSWTGDNEFSRRGGRNKKSRKSKKSKKNIRRKTNHRRQ